MSHLKDISFYLGIVVASVVLSLIIHTAIDNNSFQSAGSRFTGEDAIWLIKNSNIILTPDTKIEGQATPFRDYINSR